MPDLYWENAAAGLLKALPSPGVVPEHLAEVLAAGEPRLLSPGETLCAEGEDGNEMFVLLEGQISVERPDPVSGDPRTLIRIEAPSLVGHMALIDRSPRSATCIADTEVRATALSLEQVNALLEEPSPSGIALRRLFLSCLVRQLSRANLRIGGLVASGDDDNPFDADPDPKDRLASTTEVMHITGDLHGWSKPLDSDDHDPFFEELSSSFVEIYEPDPTGVQLVKE